MSHVLPGNDSNGNRIAQARPQQKPNCCRMTASFRPTNIEPCFAGDWNTTIGNAHTRQSMGCLFIGCSSGFFITAKDNLLISYFFKPRVTDTWAWHTDAFLEVCQTKSSRQHFPLFQVGKASVIKVSTPPTTSVSNWDPQEFSGRPRRCGCLVIRGGKV